MPAPFLDWFEYSFSLCHFPFHFPILPSTTLGWMDFCNSTCYIWWTCYFCFSVKHIYSMWEGQEARLLLLTHFIVITVLFLVTQARFWSLAPLQKKNTQKHKPEDMGQKKDLSQISTGFEEWLSFFPLQGKKLFSLVHLKLPKDREVPISDKCHCNTECSENLNFYTLEVWSWLLATAGSVWCFKEYWVLQIGTEGVNLLNPLNLKKKKSTAPKYQSMTDWRR